MGKLRAQRGIVQRLVYRSPKPAIEVRFLVPLPKKKVLHSCKTFFFATSYDELVLDRRIALARREDRGSNMRKAARKFTFETATKWRSIPRALSEIDISLSCTMIIST